QDACTLTCALPTRRVVTVKCTIICELARAADVLPMKRIAYLLILLLLPAQVDNAWTTAPVAFPPPLAEVNDEYLPTQQRSRDDDSVVRQRLALVDVKSHTADFAPVGSGLPSGWTLTTPFTPPPLYVLMSLQL